MMIMLFLGVAINLEAMYQAVDDDRQESQEDGRAEELTSELDWENENMKFLRNLALKVNEQLREEYLAEERARRKRENSDLLPFPAKIEEVD